MHDNSESVELVIIAITVGLAVDRLRGDHLARYRHGTSREGGIFRMLCHFHRSPLGLKNLQSYEANSYQSKS